MTEQATADKIVIEFKGQHLEVNIPTIEQMSVMQDLTKSVNRLVDNNTLTPAQMLAYVSRSRGMIKAMLANLDDRDWLDDMFMNNELTLSEAFAIVEAATAAIKGNEPAPTNGPAPKKAAARRAKK